MLIAYNAKSIKERSVASMLKLLRSFLTVDRKRRCLAVGLVIWLLRLVCDIEKDEFYRYSDKLDEFDLNSENVSRNVYNAVEEEYLVCECVLGFLESAIEDLEYAY